MKKPAKTSIARDAVKRRALIRFIDGVCAAGKNPDGRVNLLIAMAWDAGYESGRRRARRA
jgi:hypothetical protein